MSELQIADRIETFVRDQFGVSPDDPGFDQKTDLLEQGYLDSVGVVELLEFLREEFEVEVPEADLLDDEFATVAGMARVVYRLSQGAPT